MRVRHQSLHTHLVRFSIATGIFLLLSVGRAAAQAPGGLVLWNTLGSQTEIENSEVGLNGTITGGGFGPGMFGGAYRADFTQDLRRSYRPPQHVSYPLNWEKTPKRRRTR